MTVVIVSNENIAIIEDHDYLKSDHQTFCRESDYDTDLPMVFKCSEALHRSAISFDYCYNKHYLSKYKKNNQEDYPDSAVTDYYNTKHGITENRKEPFFSPINTDINQYEKISDSRVESRYFSPLKENYDETEGRSSLKE